MEAPGAGWIQVLEGISDAALSGVTPSGCPDCYGRRIACSKCFGRGESSTAVALGEPIAPSGRTVLWLGLAFVAVGAIRAVLR